MLLTFNFDIMATIKLGPIASDLRGKLGGVIASRNNGGNYLKAFTKPLNPQTSKQQANRGLFGTLQSQWRDLTTPEQKSWIDNAVNYPVQNKVGETVTLTGSQMYAKCNMVLAKAELPLITVLPPSPVGLVQAFAPQAFATNNPIQWDSSAPATWTAEVGVRFPAGIQDDQYLQIFASNQESPGKSAASSMPTRLLASVELGDLTDTGANDIYSYDIGTLLNDVYGLTPSQYKGTQRVRVVFYLFSSTEGVKLPVGSQIYTVEDTAA